MIASQIVFGVLDVIFYYQKQFGYFSFYVNVLIQPLLFLLLFYYFHSTAHYVFYSLYLIPRQ